MRAVKTIFFCDLIVLSLLIGLCDLFLVECISTIAPTPTATGSMPFLDESISVCPSTTVRPDLSPTEGIHLLKVNRLSVINLIMMVVFSLFLMLQC